MVNRTQITNRYLAAAFCFIMACMISSPAVGQASDPAALLKLWYKQPAAEWTEALPVGNGRLGAMVFGGVDTAQFQLNDATLWSGYPRDWNNPEAKKVLPEVRKALFKGDYQKAGKLCRQMMGPYVATYLTLGSLYLYFPKKNDLVTNYRRQLDLNRAVASVSYQEGDTHFSREVFSSYPDQILVIHLKSDKPHAISFTTRFDNPMPHLIRPDGNNMIVMEGMAPSYIAHRAYEKRQIVYDSAKSMRFAVMLKAETKDGKIRAGSNGLSVQNATEVTLFISTGTGFKGFDKMPATSDRLPSEEASKNMKAASYRSYGSLLARHEQDYQALFDRVHLHLGIDSAAYLSTDERLKAYTKKGGYCDPQLTTLLFQYGRYLMISSSRGNGQPANLQGIWNNSLQPPWSSNYTLNINTEMNYWPVEKDNLSACSAPLFHFIKELAKNGAITAKVNYGANGWVAHHNSDIWAQTAPPGDYGKDPQATPRWAMWPMSGAWLCRHVWEHYLYNGDKDFLKRTAYPLMKGAARFMIDWLTPYQHFLVTAPSSSPEHAFLINGKSVGDVSIASTMDMSIIRDLFFNTIRASRILNTDISFRDSLQKAYKKLYPFHIGRYGQLQEWYKDWDQPDDHHRHISHLYGLFPADLISPIRTPLLAAAAKKSLELRGDGGTGWSKAWKINCWARLGEGDHAYKMLNEQLFLTGHRSVNGDDRGGSYLNLFDAHPPFQIDGNFGFTSGVTEMLLQSQDGAVYLLPALPEIWQHGSVSGLKATGGFIIQDMVWEGGHLKKATLLSTLGGECRIRTNVPVKIAGAPGKVVKENTPNLNPFFQTPPVEKIVIKDSAKIDRLSLTKTYITDVNTEKGKSFEVIAE